MTRPLTYHPDPALDLVLERVVDVPRELVWKAWTTPSTSRSGSPRRRGRRWTARSTSAPAVRFQVAPIPFCGRVVTFPPVHAALSPFIRT
jgi:hypothetical protein